MFCNKCGASLNANAKFCPSCGATTALPEIAQPAQQTKKISSRDDTYAKKAKPLADVTVASGDYRSIITEIFRKYDPAKVSTVSAVLARFHGREDEVIAALKEKYENNKENVQDKKEDNPKTPSPPKSNNEVTLEKTAPPPPSKTEVVIEKPTPPPPPAREVAAPVDEKKVVYAEELPKKAPIEPQEEMAEEEFTESKSQSAIWKVLITAVIMLLLFGVPIGYLTYDKPARDALATQLGYIPAAEKQIYEAEVARLNSELKSFTEGLGIADNANSPESNNTSPTEEIITNLNASGGAGNILSLPSYIISYSAVKSKSYAELKAADLRAKGLNAGYYWIPDFEAGGKELYKVYAGPYATEREANDNLSTVQSLESEAYVIFLNEGGADAVSNPGRNGYRTVISNRAYFYDSPNGNKRSVYVITNDQVKILGEEDGFFYAEYTGSTGKVTKGWLREEDVE